jgi:hypothetical protein
MSSPSHLPQPPAREEARLEELGHPRGTLAIVIIFGLAFGLAWFAMYVFQFLGRGAPHSS